MLGAVLISTLSELRRFRVMPPLFVASLVKQKNISLRQGLCSPDYGGTVYTRLGFKLRDLHAFAS